MNHRFYQVRIAASGRRRHKKLGSTISRKWSFENSTMRNTMDPDVARGGAQNAPHRPKSCPKYVHLGRQAPALRYFALRNIELGKGRTLKGCSCSVSSPEHPRLGL